MVAFKRAANEEIAQVSAAKKQRVDTPSTTPGDSPTPTNFDASSVAGTSVTGASISRRRPKVYVCAYEGCGKAFDRPIKLQTHTNTHTGEKPFTCAEEGCDKAFYKSEHLKAHVQNTHSAVEHACAYVLSIDDSGNEVQCGKAFTTTTRLNRHVALHLAKEENRCEHCGQHFKKIEALQRHIRKEHLIVEDAFRCTAIVGRITTLSEEADFGDFDGGEECGQTFSSAGKLHRHKTREHGQGARRFGCSICLGTTPFGNSNAGPLAAATPELCDDDSTQPTSFSTYNELLAHIKEVHPPTCGDCGTVCASNSALKAHIDIYHGNNLSERKVYSCTYIDCDRSFTRKGNLDVHVQSVHVKTRKYVCGEFDLSESVKTEGWNGEGCGAALATKSSLEGHVQTQHMGISKPKRPSRLRNKVKLEEAYDVHDLMPFLDLNASTPTQSMSSATTPNEMQTLGLLTGVGYDDAHPLACLAVDNGCMHRFQRHYDLAQHLELAHGWSAAMINTSLAAEEDEDFSVDAFKQGNDWVRLNDGGHDLAKDMRNEVANLAGLDPMFEDEAMVLDPLLMEI